MNTVRKLTEVSRRVLGRIYRSNTVETIRRRTRIPVPMARVNPPDEEFLRSQRYQELMTRFTPWNGEWGRYEAQTYTRSYVLRHRTCLEELGVFRWRGLQEHLDLVLSIVADPRRSVVDLGGAGCPLGLGSVVVDRMNRDASGRKVAYHSLRELPRRVDVVFACHVLEHIEALDDTLEDIRNTLAEDGCLVALVPSFSNEGWRAEAHSNRTFGRHVWTFGLSGTPAPTGLPHYVEIDSLLEGYFALSTAEYCGDDSIICVGRRRQGSE